MHTSHLNRSEGPESVQQDAFGNPLSDDPKVQQEALRVARYFANKMLQRLKPKRDVPIAEGYVRRAFLEGFNAGEASAIDRSPAFLRAVKTVIAERDELKKRRAGLVDTCEALIARMTDGRKAALGEDLKEWAAELRAAVKKANEP